MFGQDFFGQEYFGQDFFRQYGPGGAAVWPSPGQVLSGVVYGPNGNDYTGTLVGADPAAIATAVFNYHVEGAESFLEELRLFRAVLLGKTNGVSPVSALEEFFSKDGAKVRVRSTFTPDGERTPTLADGT